MTEPHISQSTRKVTANERAYGNGAAPWACRLCGSYSANNAPYSVNIVRLELMASSVEGLSSILAMLIATQECAVTVQCVYSAYPKTIPKVYATAAQHFSRSPPRHTNRDIQPKSQGCTVQCNADRLSLPLKIKTRIDSSATAAHPWASLGGIICVCNTAETPIEPMSYLAMLRHSWMSLLVKVRGELDDPLIMLLFPTVAENAESLVALVLQAATYTGGPLATINAATETRASFFCSF